MPIIKFHNEQVVEEARRDYRLSREQFLRFALFGYKYMQEQDSTLIPLSEDETLYLSEDQSARLLALIIVCNAMMNRDAINKVNGNDAELGALITPTLAWVRFSGPVLREWRMFLPVQIAFENPEAAQLLREHILQNGYIDSDLILSVMGIPMPLARGFL